MFHIKVYRFDSIKVKERKERKENLNNNKGQLSYMAKLMQKQAKIVRDGLMGGAARISGTRLRVMDVIEQKIILGYSPEEIARAFSISLSDVHEALAYYYSHPEEIRGEIKKHKEIVGKFRKQLS